MTYNWSQVGFTHNDYRAVLRNHKLDGKQFKIDPLLREYQYNNFGLNEAYLKFVVNDINSKNLRFLHAYPSAAYTLANYVYREKKNTTLQTFLCGSETVFDYQKELIQDKLNIRMFTWYGLSEKTMLAAEGKTCMHYHANPFYSYSELIDEDGHPITAPGQSGELTGTSFFNTKMPFIRYKTGDFADFVGNTCPECGHVGLTFKNVKGRRVGDKIYKSDGSYITTTALNLHDDIYYYIKGLQYYQDTVGVVQVRVVPDFGFNSSVRLKFLEELITRAGSGIKIDIVEVKKMELTMNNKFQLLIQKLKPEQGNIKQ
jgi:phenylacetate-CoA ligase